MSMSDPIADLLTRIRNGLHVGHTRVDVPASQVKEGICKVLEQEGYIEGYKRVEDSAQGILQIQLRYMPNRAPVIRELKRISKPSLRVYARHGDIPDVRSGLGVAILTTSQGVMTNKEARRKQIGGEVLCEIW